MTILCLLFGGLGSILVMLGLKHQPLMAIFGLFVFFFWVGVMAWNYYRGAAELDWAGVTRRDKRRFEWADLLRADRIHGRLQSGELGALNHLKLKFRTGVVTIFPFTLENGWDVVAFVEKIERRKSCEICAALGEYKYASQKGGEGDSLPGAAASLRDVCEIIPGKNRTPVLQQCPSCQRYYLYETEYEYLVYGSEESQSLSRLTDEDAEKYLKR